MRALLLPLLLIVLLAQAEAIVVRPAPPFAWSGPGGKATDVRSLRGQPVVLVLARSPESRAFRTQAKRLRELYQQFAARKVIFAAAFAEGNDDRLHSDIPFVVVNNGPAVLDTYRVTDGFKLVVIGTDGNLDLETTRIASAERVRDVITNSFAAQAAVRR